MSQIQPRLVTHPRVSWHLARSWESKGLNSVYRVSPFLFRLGISPLTFLLCSVTEDSTEEMCVSVSCDK